MSLQAHRIELFFIYFSVFIFQCWSDCGRHENGTLHVDYNFNFEIVDAKRAANVCNSAISILFDLLELAKNDEELSAIGSLGCDILVKLYLHYSSFEETHRFSTRSK